MPAGCATVPDQSITCSHVQRYRTGSGYTQPTTGNRWQTERKHGANSSFAFHASTFRMLSNLSSIKLVSLLQQAIFIHARISIVIHATNHEKMTPTSGNTKKTETPQLFNIMYDVTQR